MLMICTMLVMLLHQTRVLYSMANDGLLPKRFFAAIHPKFRTPWKNTILVGTLAAVVGSVTPIDDIGKMVNIGTLLAFVIVCIAVIVLRRTDPAQPRPFRTPWVPLVPILGVMFNGYMMYKLGWINWARLIIWLVIGMVVYFAYGQKHSRVQAAITAKPDSAIILFPASTLVPSSLTISGIGRFTALTAFTMPCASTSHFMIPPKMLTRIAFTFLSEMRSLNASVTCSSVAPPPTSRKLAGLPP